jgi:hypothetical protein
MTRKHFTIMGALAGIERLGRTAQLAKDSGNQDEYLATMLVGDGTYNGLYCPTDQVTSGSASMEKQPLNLNHSLDVEDEVGFVHDVAMKGPALRGILTLNPETAKYAVAKAFIQNRMKAGKAPEVSVGFWCEVLEEHDDETDSVRYVAQNIEFDHLALVSRGACSPADGAGVGLAEPEPVTPMEPKPEGAPPVTEAAPEVAPVTPEAPPATPPPCAECKLHQERIAALESEKTKLAEDAKKTADALQVYESKEAAALTSEAHKLGVPVEATDTIPVLNQKLALGRAVREQAFKDAAELHKDAPVSVRHTAAVEAAPVDRSETELRKLLGHTGY